MSYQLYLLVLATNILIIVCEKKTAVAVRMKIHFDQHSYNNAL